MNDKRLVGFILAILFRDWKVFGVANACTIIGFLIAPLINPTWKFENSILILVGIIFVLFIFKIIHQCYKFYAYHLENIKVLCIVKGEGVYQGHNIIKLEKAEYIHNDTLLTMYSKGTGVMQPICILKVITSEDNSYMLAVQLIPDDEKLNISTYFQEEVRLKSLCVFPIINYEILGLLQ